MRNILQQAHKQGGLMLALQMLGDISAGISGMAAKMSSKSAVSANPAANKSG